MITINTKCSLINDVAAYNGIVDRAIKNLSKLLEHKGEGHEMTGWIDYDSYITTVNVDAIESATKRLSNSSDFILSIGIGGSYLGIKAFYDLFDANNKLLFAGNNLSSNYYSQIDKKIQNKDFSIIVISKSGKTTEPSVLFRYYFNKLLEKYGETEVSKRVILVTDKEKGALIHIKEKYNCDHFIIPDTIGGRFSIFTPVGLVPLAAADIDIKKIISSIKKTHMQFKTLSHSNPAVIYAVLRNYYYTKGFKAEILISYEELMRFTLEWWKQLFGESEGKKHTGLFPATAIFTTDLHSIGQYIQQGPEIFFETIIHNESTECDIEIPYFHDDFDEFNIVAGKSVEYVKNIAFKATTLAHISDNRPNVILNLDSITIETITELYLFFFFSCAISGYLLNINPFDQPGVEDYKNNMYALLGKEHFKTLKNELEQSIKKYFS